MVPQPNPKPPRWPLKFLRCFIHEEYLEEIEGDMEEHFQSLVEQSGLYRARRWYIRHMISLLRPTLIKNIGQMNVWYHWVLFRNYLKTGWRNFRKYQDYSLINVLGLSVGFAASFMLFLIVQYENSFDQFHETPENIYRVGTYWQEEGISDMIVTPQVPLMTAEYPSILAGSRFMQWEDIMRHGDNYVRSDYHYVDSAFADIFNFPVLYGDLQKTLHVPKQIAITEKLAVELFGTASAVGKNVELINDDQSYQVGAVLAEPPKNSSLIFSALIPWVNTPELLSVDKMGNWYNTFMTGFVELAPGHRQEEIEEKLVAFKERHFLEERRDNSDIILLPLVNEHFRDTGRKRILLILGIVAAAILLISCINFINLSIVQLAQRTKEVGVRKVLGSRPRQLIFQFVSENFFLCFFAISMAILSTYFFVPWVSNYFEMDLALNDFDGVKSIITFMGMAAVVVVAASSWPSYLLASKKSVHLFKNYLGWNKSGGIFRKGLMVVQFSISTFLVIGTLLVWKQINFMQTQDLNFDGSQVATVECYSELFRSGENFEQRLRHLKESLLNNPAIESVSICNAVPGSYSQNYNTFTDVDSTNLKSLSLRQLTVDEDFFETFQIPLVNGRDFNPDLKSDEQAVILNQTAVERYGWTDIQDKYIKAGHGDDALQVIGVVEDYYYQSLKEEIQPLVHFYHPDVAGVMAVKLNAINMKKGLLALEKGWSSLEPYQSFDYTFVDEEFDALYKEQKRLGMTATFFALLAVLLACLGLFSLAAYTIRLRKKEIGVRRVLGASITDITFILVRNYGLLLLMGLICAVPLVYLLMKRFLADFAHRISLSPSIFLLGGAIVILISLVIVVVQATRAALENPSLSLQEE